MTNEPEPQSEEELPNEDELWVLLNEGETDNHDSRLAIGRVLDTTVGEEGLLRVDVDILYDSYNLTTFDQDDHQMWGVNERYFHAKLPDHDEWDAEYEDLLDVLLGYYTPKETAMYLAGEPRYMTNGERGFEAARFIILDGVSDSITEFSVGHGHGAGRYGRAIRSRVEDLPDWLAKDALESERFRWEGGFWDAETASYLVEILLAKQDILDEDHEEEIRELVNEYALGYGKYLDGEWTAHDCPDCSSELLADEEGTDYVEYRCPDCEAQFVGHVETDDGFTFVVEQRLDGEEVN